MDITLKFTAQIKDVVGKASDTVTANDGTNLQQLLTNLGGIYGERFKAILFDEKGAYRHSNLIVINQSQVNYEDNVTLADGMEITLMSPISGG
ncbi:MoaD/ThiS family protein [Snuella sedimenti]|uniref:MoaD/ThiS family protein n=1 Tax=Snuella sedimenti TaxID=2798802 RepID=A0A8J7IGB4_9FLAO|nr:MoaD/ThiS family protein [Snuella sedimenti]MBJ6368957.1 MoaD/ThiS family protein [Snuella sedimenti]